MTLPKVGNVIDGRYLLTRQIAEGGMGMIFEAQHRVLSERVAIKIPLVKSGTSQSHIARFFREAQAMARCRHPGVVQIRDAGQCPTYGPYMAMEYIEGRTLESFLVARGHLSPVEAAQTMVDLAEIVDAIHANDVVHRDLKPSNVMLSWDATGIERMHLLDFGVCLLLDKPRTLTAVGEVVGTYEYMAPEQISAETPSKAIDLWALAVIAYELLTGVLPFEGTPYEIATKLVRDEPPRAPHTIQPNIPRRLSARIMAAFAQDVRARPESARAFAEDCRLAFEQGALNGGPERPERPAAKILATKLMGDDERRVQRRAPFIAPVRFFLHESVVTDGRLEDISEGGFLAMIDGVLKEGTVYTARFCMPYEGRVVSEAVVVRWFRAGARRNAVGLSFMELSVEVLHDIRLYVQTMQPPSTESPP